MPLVTKLRRVLSCCLLAVPVLHAYASTSPPASLSAGTTAFLSKYVNAAGNVNYAAIKRNSVELKALLRRVETFEAAAAKPAEREAFYLNAYNLLVIGEIVARYPLESVQKVPGFFDKNLVSVAGEKLTLNDLEAQKLRQPYADPRVHFALVCGAKGCPRLSRTAYAAAQLDRQLTTQARNVLQDPTFIRVDSKGRRVQLSQIFKWYEADFKASGKTGLAYVNQFRAGKTVPATFTVDYYAYDWSLNAQK